MKKEWIFVVCLVCAAAVWCAACGRAAETQNAAESGAAPADSFTEADSVEFDPADAAAAGEKIETVTVHADAAGTPKRTSVSCELDKVPESGFVLDRTSLTDIRNADGDEQFQLLDDGTLLWQNLGQTIRYEGDADTLIPVGVKVRYFLDGKEMQPSKIAGRSGDVRVRFEYVNNDSRKVKIKTKAERQDWEDDFDEDDEDSADGDSSGDSDDNDDDSDDEIKKIEVKKAEDLDLRYEEEERTITYPYLFVTAAILPEDTFTHIEVENGKVAQLGNMTAVIGYAIPGLADTLKLDGLELTEDIEIPEYVEFTAHTDDFHLEFTATFASDGLFGELDTEDLKDADEMDEGMKILNKVAGKFTEGTGDLLDGADELYDALVDYANGVNSVYEGVQTLTDGVLALEENSAALTDGSYALAEGLAALNGSLASIDQEALAAAGLPEDLEQTLSQLKEGVAQLDEGAAALNDGVIAYTGGVSYLADGAIALEDGAGELSSAGQDLSDAYGKLFDGIDVLKDSFAAFDEDGISELTDMGGQPLLDVIAGLRSVAAAEEEEVSFSGCADETEPSVRYMIETEEVG